MKRYCLLWGILLLGGMASAEGYVKYVRQLFPVGEGTHCLMDCKFGRIHLQQWGKDSLLVEASFRVEQAEEWEKESLAEQLGIEVKAWPGVWKMYTQIGEGFEHEGDLAIEMKIFVPRKIVLDVVNRYGDIRVPVYQAVLPLSLTAVYGNIRIDSIASLPGSPVRLNVSYGELDVRNCEKADIRSTYSVVGVKTARYLQIKAEKSAVSLQAADTVLSEGSYNRYEVK